MSSSESSESDEGVAAFAQQVSRSVRETLQDIGVTIEVDGDDSFSFSAAARAGFTTGFEPATTTRAGIELDDALIEMMLSGLLGSSQLLQQRLAEFEAELGEGNKPRGASESAIAALPKRAVGAADVAEQCSICITHYAESEHMRELPCAHAFHCDCIDAWLRVNASCPLCRTSIADHAVSP